MPLDGHSYLVSQGWSGKGTGLRQGAISRPLAIPLKRTLAGLGKDRDEAFPFWDHLFNAAAKAIQVKVHDDSDGSSSDTAEEPNHNSAATAVLKRTTTGILSNRRPVMGTPASAGSSTPTEEPAPVDGPRLSLISVAKREYAKKMLYARFFRGPILGPEEAQPSIPPITSRSQEKVPLVPVEPISTSRDDGEHGKAARAKKKLREKEEKKVKKVVDKDQQVEEVGIEKRKKKKQKADGLNSSQEGEKRKKTRRRTREEDSQQGISEERHGGDAECVGTSTERKKRKRHRSADGNAGTEAASLNEPAGVDLHLDRPLLKEGNQRKKRKHEEAAIDSDKAIRREERRRLREERKKAKAKHTDVEGEKTLNPL